METNKISENNIGKVTTVSNTDLIIINVSEDKLRLNLRDYIDSIKKTYKWTIPFGFFVSLLQSFFTADYKAVFGIRKENVKVFFVFLTIIFAIWFVGGIIYILYIYFTKKTNVDKLICAIKGQT